MRFITTANKICSLLLLALFLCAVSAPVAFAQTAANTAFISSNLPILIIDTRGDSIPDSPRIEADLTVIYNGDAQINHIDDPPHEHSGPIGIELRGATSAAFAKKPYRFETIDGEGNNRNVPLLDLPAENDWILHNPYSDKSLIRNVLAYDMARQLGTWASRARLCELVLNGQYQGVYVLLEKIKRDKNRIDIARLESDEIAGDDLTGGYIVKIDRLSGEQSGHWDTQRGSRYRYHYPAPDDITPAQKRYIINWMNDFESHMAQAIAGDSTRAYAQYINVDSFVDYFLLNEFSRNIDAYRLSTYLYKDKKSKDDRLHMVVWDYNIAFGNADFYAGQQVAGWNLDLMLAPDFDDPFKPPFWWKNLRQDQQFMLRAARRWRQVRADQWRQSTLLSRIDSLAERLTQAQARNFARWPVLGQHIWPNAFVGATYAQEIDYLSTWIMRRGQWLDDAFTEIANAADSSGTLPYPEQNALRPNRPNPFVEQTQIHYALRQPAHVEIAIYNLLGQRVSTLFDDAQNAGEYTLRWRGKNDDGRTVASGLYFVHMKTDRYESSSKIMFTR